MFTTAKELKTLLKKFNKGVKSVSIDQGMVCVYVSSRRAVHGVTLDLLLSGGFRSVARTENKMDGGFIVHAIPV